MQDHGIFVCRLTILGNYAEKGNNMPTIGGKTKTVKATQPQFVVQIADHINEYLKFETDEKGFQHVSWVGDPNAATKFDSKYAAKTRVREIENVPATRCYREV